MGNNTEKSINQKLHKDNQTELFPLVDACGNVLGSISRKDAHCGTKLLHPVVHLHVFNSDGKLYLQKRPAWKDIQPDRWDTACGGHVDYGEEINQALKREVFEELGITDYEATFIKHYVFESSVERELVNVFITTYDGDIHPSSDELAGGRFWSAADINANIGKGVFTPNFEREYKEIISKL